MKKSNVPKSFQLKVLHVIPSISHAHGGPSRAIRLMEQALAGSAWQCTTVTTDDDGPGRHLRCTLHQPVPAGSATRWYFHKNTEFYKCAWRFVPWVMHEVRCFDVVHIHALFSFTSIVAALAARLAGVPYIIRPLGTLTNYGRSQRRPWLKRLSLKWIEGPLLREAAAVHFTSYDEQREAADCGELMRGVVIPLGLCTPAPADDALVRARFAALNSAPYLLFLSRLDPKKNIEALLRAYAQCRTQWPQIKLLIAGTGPANYVASLALLADELNLKDSVIWSGHIDGALKLSALGGATLFVLPSFSENFGIAAAEALMAGLPCLLGQGVAIATDVVQAGAGVSVPPTTEGVAAGLRDLLAADETERARMSANAAALARDRFSVEALGYHLVALYSGIVCK